MRPLDRAAVERLLAKIRAPSGDNCQPWHFLWNAPFLLVFRDAKRARHRLDSASVASLLALGCLLESLEIAASGEGARASILLLQPGDEIGRPWAEVAFTRTDGERDPLTDVLRLRATDRRAYRREPLPPEVERALFADDTADTRVRWAPCPLDGDLLDYVARSERFLAEDERALGDVLKWVRFTDEEILATRDGMPVAGLGVRWFERASLRAVRDCPRLRSWFCKLGAAALQMKVAREHLESSAGLVCVTARGIGPEDVVSAGARAFRAWLVLNAAGFGVQPLSQCTVLLHNHRTGTLPDDTPERWHAHYRNGEAVLRRAFSLPDHEVPMWMFRTGRSEPLPESQRTWRLDVGRTLP